MILYLYNFMNSLRSGFSRTSTWVICCMVIIGFIGSSEMIGVSSFCRFWGLGGTVYNVFLNFFRSNAWSVEVLAFHWASFVLSQNVIIQRQGRAVLLGDHTCVPKDARRMPGVTTLHQHSETQSKPSYFRGHFWGAVSALVGTMYAPFSLPLLLSIHLGQVHIGEDQSPESEEKPETTGSRIVNMALDFALKHNIPSTLVLDAFFPCQAVFRLAESIYSIELKRPLLNLIVRAKRNYVAYFPAEKPPKGKPGRRPKYGKKVRLMEMFDHEHFFHRTQCSIYNKSETISLAVFDLLWKPTGSMIRFVLAVTSVGPIVLMCSDLNQDPKVALELYCARTRIETMFDMLKNLIGAFGYRFWSKEMPKHSRKPLKNKKLKKPNEQSLRTVRNCWEACERFVMLGAVSLGLLQLLALKFQNTVWDRYEGFLRTRSRELPSERTVKHVMRSLLSRDFYSFAPAAIMRKILSRYFCGKDPHSKQSSCNDDEAA